MIKLNLFEIFIIILVLSCSSTKENFDPSSLEGGLKSLDEKNHSMGPQLKEKTDFIDMTKAYGLGDIEATNFNVVDLDGDDFSDLVVIPDYYAQPRFFRFNVHKNKFEEFESPFAEPIKASYILFYDLDRDQYLDAIVGVLNQKTEMAQNPIRIFKGGLKNQKLHLVEQKRVIPTPPGPSATVGLVDFDLDGDLDIFIGNWFSRYKGTPIPHRDILLEFENEKYRDSSNKLLTEQDKNTDGLMYVNATPTFASQICDLDQNGFPDILSVSTNGYQNKLWMNQYKIREKVRYFKDYGVISGFAGDTEGSLTSRGGGRSFSTACADYNEDGIMDVFMGELAHNYDSELVDKSSILTGSTFKFPPKFLRTEYFLDTDDLDWHQADRRAVWFDYNNDGLLDLLVDNSGYPPHTRLILFKQYPDHSFENVAKNLGIDIVNPLSTVVADFNRDGKLDILTAQSSLRDVSVKKRVFLFENHTDTKNKTPVRFYLRGNKSNYHGLNAMIILKVQTAEGIKLRRQNVTYSYGSLPPQNEEGVLFAINEGEKILSVKVRWPYSKTLNQSRAGLEKVYKIKADYLKAVNITLCENGDYLVGRLPCKN